MTKVGNSKNNKLDVKDKIDHVLDEIRVVLPGTEVLLGFQFSAFFTEGFSKLSPLLRYLHLISLGFITFSIMLLMSPVAYHRIVERGEDTRRFHNFASKILVLTLIFLGLGLAADIFVVVDITINSWIYALAITIIFLLTFYSVWFGYPLLKQKK